VLVNASDAAHHAGGVVFGLVGVACAIGFMAMIALFYFSVSALLYKGTKSLLTPVDECEDKFTIRYSLPSTTNKEKRNDRTENPARNSRQDSSFFSDVAGVDLEYRGVGAAEDGRASRGVGKAVSKGL
jgi:hypothetical protein